MLKLDMDSSVLAQRQLAGWFGDGNEPVISIRYGELPD
jgi:hypothetical protein